MQGKLLASAHDVEREYTVQKALGGTGLPVPRMLAFCADAAVLGTPFYVMQHVAGRVFLDARLPDSSAHERAAAYAQAVSCLAELHAVRPAAAGLAGFGGRGAGEHYAQRQLERWAQQYAAAAPTPDPAMAGLIAFLREHAPKGPTEVTVVHGDFRIDNLIFHPTEAPLPLSRGAMTGLALALCTCTLNSCLLVLYLCAPSLPKRKRTLRSLPSRVTRPSQPRVLAILDWELSTLGDPLSDVAYLCLPYHVPGPTAAVSGDSRPALFLPLPPGVPTEAQLRAAYFRARGQADPFVPGSGAPPPPAPWSFYLALGAHPNP